MTLLVSCVDKSYRTHPHRLVLGNDCSEDGVCKIIIKPESNMICELKNLKLQMVKKDDIESELRKREANNVDPFEKGFDHAKHTGSISLHTVHLCFQTIATIPMAQMINPPKIVISDPIQYGRDSGPFKIAHYSGNESSIHGGQKIILLLSKGVSAKVEVCFRFSNGCK